MYKLLTCARKAFTIALIAVFCGTNISFSQDNVYYLSPQSIFQPLERGEIRDIGIIRYFIFALGEAGADISQIAGDIDLRVGKEKIGVSIKFSEKKQAESPRSGPNGKALLVPSVVGGASYYAYVTFDQGGLGPSDITVFTKEEFDKLRNNGAIAHGQRSDIEESEIKHEEKIDTPLSITHGDGNNARGVDYDIKMKVMAFFKAFGASQAFLNEAAAFLGGRNKINIVQGETTINIEISYSDGAKVYDIPVKIENAHASNRYMNIPQDVYDDLAKVIVHELGAKSGFSHDFNARLDEIYTVWARAAEEQNAIDLRSEYPKIYQEVAGMRVKDLSKITGRDLSMDGGEFGAFFGKLFSRIAPSSEFSGEVLEGDTPLKAAMRKAQAALREHMHEEAMKAMAINGETEIIEKGLLEIPHFLKRAGYDSIKYYEKLVVILIKNLIEVNRPDIFTPYLLSEINKGLRTVLFEDDTRAETAIDIMIELPSNSEESGENIRALTAIVGNTSRSGSLREKAGNAIHTLELFTEGDKHKTYDGNYDITGDISAISKLDPGVISKFILSLTRDISSSTAEEKGRKLDKLTIVLNEIDGRTVLNDVFTTQFSEKFFNDLYGLLGDKSDILVLKTVRILYRIPYMKFHYIGKAVEHLRELAEKNDGNPELVERVSTLRGQLSAYLDILKSANYAAGNIVSLSKNIALTTREEVVIVLDDGLAPLDEIKRVLNEITRLGEDDKLGVILFSRIKIISGRGVALTREVERYIGEKNIKKENVIIVGNMETHSAFYNNLGKNFLNGTISTFVDDSEMNSYSDYYPLPEIVLFTMAKWLRKMNITGYDENKIESLFKLINANVIKGAIIEDINLIHLIPSAQKFNYNKDLRDVYILIQETIRNSA